jgi:capsular exopolysaccharide synthesis family protein
MKPYSRYRANSGNKREKSLLEIIYIIYRRKVVFIISVSVLLVLAFFYNYLTPPAYEATVLVKKEIAPENQMPNEFYEIVRIQTEDEVETEMELVKTGEVLGKAARELNLFLSYDKFVNPNGSSQELNNMAVDYLNPKVVETLTFRLPRFISIDLKEQKRSAGYYIKKVSKNVYSLYNTENDNLLQSVRLSGLETETQLTETDSLNDSSTVESFIEFNTDLATIKVDWSDADPGSVFYFTLNSYYDTIIKLSKQIAIERKGKTNVFTVSVKSSSAYSAAVLANILIEKFRESRIDQQKQTIRYSFNFVDEQLEQMQGKLRQAEDNLSGFKSSGQITTIDASSAEVIKFLSSLEAEKMNTELELTGYKNKLSDMKKELESSGYFDQSFLSPSGNDANGNNPFSSLLTQLSDLELKRLELLQKRTENHPDVINLDEQIKLAKAKLASYNQNTLTAYQIIINSLEKKQLDIINMMSKYEVKLEMLPGQENRLARLIREKDVYEKMFTLLLDKREEMRLAELSKLQDIIIVDSAKEPLNPVSPRKMLNMFIALILGSFIGIIGIFLLELKNSKLVNLDEIEDEFQIPIFALIPSFTKKIRQRIDSATDSKNKFVTLMEDQDGFRESFRLLKTKLRIQMEGREKVFMITSCEEDTGKTTVVANLALSFAQENKRVLVIDCDLRKAQLTSMFGLVKNDPGLIDFLTKETAPQIYTKVLKKLDILPTGGLREDSSHLLNSEKMNELFNAIDFSAYDYIILDTPPVTRIVDTLILGKYVKDAVLVVRPNLSHNEAVWGGILEMIQAKIKIRGIIVNGAEIKESYYYRYRYGYGYGYSRGGKKSESKKESKVVGSIAKTTLN